MAPIISVKVRTRGLSAGWNDRKEWLHITVRLGLESDGYVVLTVDDSVRLAAQVGGPSYKHHCSLVRHPTHNAICDQQVWDACRTPTSRSTISSTVGSHLVMLVS